MNGCDWLEFMWPTDILCQWVARSVEGVVIDAGCLCVHLVLPSALPLI